MEGQILWEFLKRYNEEKLQMEKCLFNITIAALMRGIRDTNLRKLIDNKKLTSLSELLYRVNEYIWKEEANLRC